jgi:Family of unknown function (DUF5681)
MTTIADLRDALVRDTGLGDPQARDPDVRARNQDEQVRDAQGRFLPGHSGNPAGRPPGARNRRTILAAALAEGEGEAIARQVVEKALAGDGVAARFCLDRLCPKPRGREITLDLPEDLSSGGAVVAAFNAALKAMAAGEITPEEAVTVARFLEGRLKALKAWQLERKLTWCHDSPPIPGDGGGGMAGGDEEEDCDEEEDVAEEEPLAFSSPLEERMGEGEQPQARSWSAGRGAAPSAGLSPRGEEMSDGTERISLARHQRGEGPVPEAGLYSACIFPSPETAGDYAAARSSLRIQPPPSIRSPS